MGAYVFDNSWEKERERLAGLEASLDPGTTRHMESIGVGPGWTCLEVAGGGGSITQWLCGRVGPQGKVVATDINTRFLDALSEPNLDVRLHDITMDDLPEQSFDLIHSRLLLEHLPAREVALKRMVSALKPGGWIMIEDLDWAPMLAKPPVFQTYPIDRTRRTLKVWRALLRVMQSNGYDESYGRRLPAALTEEGLEDVGAEIRSFLVRGGDPGTAAPLYSLIQLRERFIEMGLLTNKEIDRQIEWLSDPKGFWMYPLMTAAWGRKAGALSPAIKVQPIPERRERLVDRLRLVPLLEHVDESELVRIAPLPEELDVETGALLTEEGTPGGEFFIILTGTATVERQGHRLATLGPGSFFGEVAVLTHGLRTATVKADCPMRLLRLDERRFRTLLSTAPAVSQKLMEGLAERLKEADEAITR